MELNRRNFIKFLVGGVVGTTLSPLPWKLTDDIAIWTQNWPWVPVPPEGEFLDVKSVCNLCPGGCGIEIRKVSDRAVKIEGRTDYPINPGGICPLGAGGLQLLYDESIRYTSPMKRVGERGSGQFSKITWDEALNILISRITDLQKNGKAASIVAVDGNPARSTIAVMIERLLTSLGSPNYIRIPTIEDTYSMGNILMQGNEGAMGYDLENADYVLSFGCGLLEGWGAPGRIMNAWGIWHENPGSKKVRIVQVESRASNTASKADKWVASKPGTDAALALGIAHIIIKEGLFDREFVNKYSFGFEDWTSADGKEHKGFKTIILDNYSPARVSDITGLDPNDIVSLARDFARSKAPVAIYGKGKDSLNGSLYEFMAVHCLNALVGNLNKPGGVIMFDSLPLTQFPDLNLDSAAKSSLKKPRLDQAGTVNYPFSRSLINNFTQTIIKESENSVDTLLVFSANPCFTIPDGGAFKEAINKIPFTVSFSPFKDETSEMADLILPDHTYLEKTDDVVCPDGLQYQFYGLSKPAVKPLYNTKNTGDVIIDIAKMVAQSAASAFPWKNFEEALKQRAKGLYESGSGFVTYNPSIPPWKQQNKSESQVSKYNSFDKMWEKIESGGFWYRPAYPYKRWDGLFKTPSGKFEFYCSRIELAVNEYSKTATEKNALANMGINGTGDEIFMPHYEVADNKGDSAEYPLLMLPYDMINISSSWVPSPPFLYKTLFDNQLKKDESFASINSKTAKNFNLKQGDRVIVKSPAGEAKVRVNISQGAMPGIVYLPFGLGHSAYDEFIRGKGVNPNQIIYALKDPLSGHAVWWNTHVKLIKV